MGPNDLEGRALALYEAGDDDGLWRLADEVWPEDPGDLTEEIAAVCLHARTAHARAGRWASAGLWGARAMIAAVLTGSRTTAARLLLPEYFGMIRRGDFDEARVVIDEMPKLVDVTSTGQGGGTASFGRVYHEKLGFLSLMAGRYEEALEDYRRAQQLSGHDVRGKLKARGGAYLAAYLASPDDDARATLEAGLRRIGDEARSQGFADVATIAADNLTWVEAGADVGGWQPFEVT